jgi:chorismate mutase
VRGELDELKEHLFRVTCERDALVVEVGKIKRDLARMRGSLDARES